MRGVDLLYQALTPHPDRTRSDLSQGRGGAAIRYIIGPNL